MERHVVTIQHLEVKKKKIRVATYILIGLFILPPEMEARIISTEGFAVARYFKAFNCARTLQRFKMHLKRFIAKENPSLAIRHETTPGLGSPRVADCLRQRECVGATPVLAAAGDKELGRVDHSSDLVWLSVHSHSCIC